MEAGAGQDGPVGYLFTDIVASVGKWERTPDAMRSALSRHDALIDAVVARNGGVIQDRAGDGVFAFFPSGDGVGGPLRCALELQRAMQKQNWDEVGELWIRIGVHCGAKLSAAVPDKASVNRAARIMGAAWGGQIVISADAAEAYATPARAELVDLGAVRLRGFDEPIGLFCLIDPELQRREFPPPRGALSGGFTVPAQLSPLYGRAEELSAVLAKLRQEERELTIVGPGGAGKTRLALEAAAKAAEVGAVYFVSLQNVFDGADMTTALARAMEVPLHRRASPQAQLISYLREKPAFIVMDNADHLVGRCQLVGELLAACPELKVLITSREPLGIEGETVFRLGGLAGPRRGDPEFRSSPACVLFIQEARSLEPDFDLGEGDLEAFCEICDLLGGSPLALHLTAQWTHLLSLQEIVDKLRSDLRFLDDLGDARLQKSLEGVFQRSWAFLDAHHREALSKLSVFEGGFDRQAAAFVADADVAILNLLERKCLIERRANRRFAMHPLIHAFAKERLENTKAAASRSRDAHSRYFLNFARQCMDDARDERQSELLDAMHRDIANVRAAFKHAAACKNYHLLGASIDAIFYTWALLALLQECASLFEVSVDDLDLQGHLDAVRATCIFHQGAHDAADKLAREVLASGVKAPGVIAHCHHALASVAHASGAWTEASSLYQQALTARQALSDDIGAYYSAISLALLDLERGRIDDARARTRQAQRHCLRAGHLGGMQAVHRVAGDIATKEGRLRDAHANYRQALEIEDTVRQPQMRAMTLVKFAAICMRLDENDAAQSAFLEACAIARQVGDARVELNARIGLAGAMRAAGAHEAARGELRLGISHAFALDLRQQLAAALVEFVRLERAVEDFDAATRALRVLAALGGDRSAFESDAIALEPERTDVQSEPCADIEEMICDLLAHARFRAVGL